MGELFGALVILSPLILMLLNGACIIINHVILRVKYKRIPECDCPLPSKQQVDFGDLFVCPDCAWVHQYDYDDFSSGWCWMTWHAHLRHKLGIYPADKYLEPDPIPTVGKSVEHNLTQRARLMAHAFKQAVRR